MESLEERKGAGCQSKKQGKRSRVECWGGGGSEAHPVLSRGAQSRTNELRLAY